MTSTGLYVVALAVALLTASDEDHTYRLRGDAQNKRYEGTTREPVSGGPCLISLLGHRFDPSGKPLPEKLRVRFFLPEKGTAHVTAREIEKRESYRMKVARENWEAGWAEFSEWPTAEVIKPLEIDLANIGVLVRKTPRDGSGTVYPAMLCTDSWPERVESYRATIKSKYSCAPVKWEVTEIDTGRLVHESRISKLPALTPRTVTIDLSGAADGWFRLKFTWQRAGRGSGGNPRISNFDFYHRGNTESSGGGERERDH